MGPASIEKMIPFLTDPVSGHIERELRVLIRMGLVIPTALRRRNQIIEYRITKSGTQLLQTIGDKQREWWRRVGSKLGVKKIEAVTAGLIQVRNILDDDRVEWVSSEWRKRKAGGAPR
jgi:hypothetical protein